MSLDNLIETWKDVRAGLTDEVSLIPADKFSFQPTAEIRSVETLVKHIIESQKVLVGEMCRPDSNLRREPFPDLIKRYAGEVSGIEGKDALIDALRSSIAAAEQTIRSFGESALNELTQRFDGKTVTKLGFLQFSTSHEMYHRGQLTVYQRLLGIEPALTTRIKKLFATGR